MQPKPDQGNYPETPAAEASAITVPSTLPQSIHIIGPRDGYTLQVGTLVSMLTWLRTSVVKSVENLTQEALDHRHDPDANTIGAMLLHLVATEKRYQCKTFGWDADAIYDESVNWEAAMLLGPKGQQHIKGHGLDFYLHLLNETRQATLTEMKHRDDHWLAEVDPVGFHKLPTNNYCKWFHVCEHESNHNGQIKWIKSRLPEGMLAKR